MPGIFGIISENDREIAYTMHDHNRNFNNENHLADFKVYPNAVFGRNSINKFKNEKIFQYDNDCLISTDGVILNLRHLQEKNRVKSLFDLILKLYKQKEYKFPEKFRGSFSGFIYLKNENTILIFTDHLCTRPVYYLYRKENGLFIFGSDLEVITKTLQKNNITLNLDINAAYCMLTIGHMLGDLTLVQEIKKVPPGSVLIYSNQELTIKKFYEITNRPIISENENQILQELAKRFKRAVLLEYAKDLEYGYDHIATLSGGLDSRSNVAFAKNLNFSPITCFTISQSNYYDHKIAQKISHENDFKFMFFPLEWGNHLIKYMDEIIKKYGGQANYSSICHIYYALKQMELEKYGLLHTGVLGGEIFGEYIPWPTRAYSLMRRSKYDNFRYFRQGGVSSKYIDRISSLLDAEISKYNGSDLFKFHSAGINAQLVSMQVLNHLIDTTSPHINIDFLEYVLRLPIEYRKNKKIYLKMIKTYTPKFAKYTWESHYISPARAQTLYSLKGYDVIWPTLKKGIFKMLPHYNMCPVDYWYKKNKLLKKGIDNAFSTNIDLLEQNSRLKNDCETLFQNGDFKEKTAVITLLKAINTLGLKNSLA